MCVHTQLLTAGSTPSTDRMVGHMLDDNELLLRDNKTAKVILNERLYAKDVYDPEMIALARKLCEANSDHPEFYLRYMPMVQQIKWGNLKLTNGLS